MSKREAKIIPFRPLATFPVLHIRVIDGVIEEYRDRIGWTVRIDDEEPAEPQQKSS